MSERSSRRAVVLLSGGLDSGVAAASFVARGGSLALCLFADYGQRAAVPEHAAASSLARRFGAVLERVPLPWLGMLAQRTGARLMPGTGELPRGSEAVPGDAESAARVWIPARNALLLAVAAAHAETLAADCVVAGFNREEAQTFPDNSAEFLAAATAMLAFGTRNRVTVESPTLEWDKPRIVAEALRLGFAPNDFWSCYGAGPDRCGVCESCLRSRWRR